jgi:hypothetical protein
MDKIPPIGPISFFSKPSERVETENSYFHKNPQVYLQLAFPLREVVAAEERQPGFPFFKRKLGRIGYLD